MKRSLIFLGCLLAGCSGKVLTRSEPNAPECTDQTPLTNGVPGSPGHLIASERNPNGDSELAALMRVMQAELLEVRATLKEGGAAPPLYERYSRIRCSWPTSASDRAPPFDQNAQRFLTLVRQLDVNQGKGRAEYNAVIAGCRACHTQTCPGPLTAIDEMAW